MKKLITIGLVFCLVLIGMPLLNAASYGWGFKKNKDHQCPNIGIYASEIEGTSSYYVGNTNEKTIYLTFDAGYDNGVLPGILDVLKSKNLQCTFFVTGDFIKRESELLLRMVNEGHIIGNHTWSHKHITTLSFEALEAEIKKVEDAYTNLTQKEMIKFFRPPAGEFNRESLLNVQKLGYSTIFWSLAYQDWEANKQRGGEYAYKSVMDYLHNGAIILMHTVSKDNLDALPRIIDDIRYQGYTIENLDNLVKNVG